MMRRTVTKLPRPLTSAAKSMVTGTTHQFDVQVHGEHLRG